MVALVEQMLALHKRRAAARTPHEQTVLQAQIDATDRQMALCARFAIDRLVYELYGLTEEETRIVEGIEGALTVRHWQGTIGMEDNAMTTVTLELPQRIYQRAAEIAKLTKRPIEQVVAEWIQPPPERSQAVQEAVLADLESMSTAQLAQIAQTGAPSEDTERLRQLLSFQEQRAFTRSEYAEAARLVEQEDLITLRKAKAIFLLKQRNALPSNLADPGR